MLPDLYVVAVAVTLAAACIAGIKWRREVLRERRIAALAPDRTPVERPTLNPANRPLVNALYGAANAIEENGIRVSDGLRDIARAVQMYEPAPVGDLMHERIARQLDENVNGAKRAALHFRESAKEPA